MKELSERIYGWVKDLPVVDWHNHLDVGMLAEDKPFGSLYEVWVKTDPYKHRAMRICGESERLITGDASDDEKMAAWERTLPKLVGNPLFAWAQMEREFLQSHPLETLTPLKLLKSFNVVYASPCVTTAQFQELGRRASCPSEFGPAALGRRASCPSEFGPAPLGRRASCPSESVSVSRLSWTPAFVHEFSCTRAETQGHYSPALTLGTSYRRKYPHIGQNSTLVSVTFRLADSLPESQLRELEEIKREWLKAHPEPWDDATRSEWQVKIHDQIDCWLDAGHGSCILADERCRQIVEKALEFFDANDYGSADGQDARRPSVGPTGILPVGVGARRPGPTGILPVGNGSVASGPTGILPVGTPARSAGRPRYRLHAYIVMPNHVHALFELFDADDLPAILHSWKSFTASRLNKLLGRSGQIWREEYFDRLIRNAEHYENVISYYRENGAVAEALTRERNGRLANGGADGQDARRPRIVPSLRMNAGDEVGEEILRRFHEAGCRVVDISVDDDVRLESDFESLAAVAGFAAAHGWTMLLHLGALRDTSARLRAAAGPAGGFAGMRAPVDPGRVARFLNRLEARDGQDARRPSGLPRTVLLSLNPEAHAQLAVLAGSFVEDGVPGKVQLGPAWWWCDHREGIFDVFEKNAAYGVLSTFLGMTTDSRSLLSFVRHDYFRRLFSRWLAGKVADGDIPGDEALLRPLAENVCSLNAQRRFCP